MSGRRRPCGVCPIWKAGWCPHLAEMRPPKAPACDFGLHEMNKEYHKNYSANRRKLAKEQMSNSRPNPAGEIGQIGSAAKLRETVKETKSAIARCMDILNKIPECGYNALIDDVADELCDLLEEHIKTALAEPPRNCDVGTAEDQAERYLKLKKEYIERVTYCPAQGSSYFPESLWWAQLPYESEAAK